MSKMRRIVSRRTSVKPANRRSDRGLTIIEALASSVILALTMVAVVNLFPVSTTMNARAERRNEAMLLAEDKIEEFRSLGFLCIEDTIALGFTSGADTFGHIIRNWDLTDNGTLIDIDITCSWPIAGGIGNSQAKVITMMSRYE